jgi:release factor glutamine methyltransferase
VPRQSGQPANQHKGRLIRPTLSAHDAINRAAARLRQVGIDNPRLDARLLLAHALGTTPSELLRDPDRAVDVPAFQALVDRRASREPLALIVGRREFWSLEFVVSPATLIPRPDTETLIEAALTEFSDREPPRRVLDLGTGTGCLLLAAMSEFPAAFGVGVDRSLAAASLAARNAAMLGMRERTTFLCADWTAALDGRFDLILCNPPYIPTSELDGLMPDVVRYEPRTALDGGTDGCSAHRHLIPELMRLLVPDGAAMLEIGAGQSPIVSELARDAGFACHSCHDLSGIVRALVLKPALP